MIRTHRTRVLALSAGAVLAFLVPGASAQDAPRAGGGSAAKPELDPAELYAAKKREYIGQISGKFELAASFAMNNKLKRTGLNVWQLILEFNPDHEKARRELGWDRKGQEWVANEGRQKRLDELEDESEKKRADFEKRLKEANVASGRMLAELGELAEKAGDEETAKAHWKKALELDDQNPMANQKSGNRLVDGKWFTERALHHKEFQKVYNESLGKAQKMPVAPVPCDETSGVAERAGIQVKRYKTKNFRIESNLTDADIKETLVWLERARQFYMDLFDVPERFVAYELDPLVYVIVTTPEQKDKLIDACDMIEPNRKSFMKKFGSVKVTNKLELCTYPNGESATRQTVHTATHTFTTDTFGRHATWLYEALGNAVAAALRGSDLIVCFSGQGSTGGIHMERLSLDQAPALLRDLVLAKKDTPIGEFVKLPPDGMSAQQIAKAWSVVMFLMERDRAQAREYFLRAGQGQDGELSKDEKVVAQYYEDFKTWKDLDTAWREWALDVYKN